MKLRAWHGVIAAMAAYLPAEAIRAADRVTVARGLASSVLVPNDAGQLRATPQQSPNSPIIVRVLSTTGNEPQRINFIGLVPGVFDLRNYVEPIAPDSGGELPSMPVEIVSVLPPGQVGALESLPIASPPLTRGYTSVVAFLAMAWLSIPVIVLISRARKRQLRPARPNVGPPSGTLIDDARALLCKGRAESLSIDERGRLELIMFQLFMEHAGIRTEPQGDISIAARLRELREHPQMRVPLLALETWLHAGKAEISAVERLPVELVHWLQQLNVQSPVDHADTRHGPGI